jgi:hypothetical protein
MASIVILVPTAEIASAANSPPRAFLEAKADCSLTTMDRSHTLLMIGPDHQALEAIQEHDIDVTVLLGGVSKDIGLPIPPGPRVVFNDDSKNIDSALNCLYRHGLDSFEAVYAHDEPAMMTAAVIAKVLGAKGIPPRTVSLFRDKWQQKRVLREAGYDVARHVLIEDIRDLPADFELPFAKGVVKPVAGQATQTTYPVSDTADVQKISRDCRANNVVSRTFVVEEYVEGEELFADGVVSGGKLRFASLGRYGKNCLAAVRDRSPVRTYTLDPVADKALHEQALPVVSGALSTLGLDDGVFHMELFHDGSRMVFSECAARRAGGPISDQVRLKFGVDLAALSVLSQLSPLDDIVPTTRDGVIASAFLPLVDGTLLDHPSIGDMLERPGVIHARFFVPKGLRTAPIGGNTVGRMGEFSVLGENMEKATTLLDETAAWFTAQLNVLPLAPTMRELRLLNLGG